MLIARSRRWLLAIAMFPLVPAACAGTADRLGSGTGTTAAAAGSGSTTLRGWGLSAVRHVWVIVLENRGCWQSFATPSADPNLTRTLPRMGALLEDSYEIGHGSAALYVALVSGQAPSLATQADCPVWTPFPRAVVAGP